LGKTTLRTKGGKRAVSENPLVGVFEMYSEDSTEKLQQLVARLGFEPLEDLETTWAVVGWILAQRKQEFRKRGRRSLKDAHKLSIDFERYISLQNRCQQLGEELSKTVTHEAAIERAIDDGIPLFSGELDSLKASVSRGRRDFLNQMRQLQKTASPSLRRVCETFRIRAKWVENAHQVIARLDALGGWNVVGLTLLSPDPPEIAALKQRLRNPFRRAL